jgi:hypothetical protein
MSASTDLDRIAPQFAADANKNNFIADARLQTNVAFYGANSEMAVALRAAHMMTLRDNATAGGGGIMTSKREGDLAVTFAAGTDPGGLDSTTYGIWLKGLRRGQGAAVMVTGGNDAGV